MCLNPKRVKGQFVSCGKCFECKKQKSNEWAFRVFLESKNYDSNCFITLTYNDENLPPDSLLKKRDLQLFIKRLRKYLGNNKIRYFSCGEYGKKRLRPHYHIIIFGYQPTDLYYFCKDNKGTLLYRSPTIEKLWPFGFSSIGQVNFDTCLYTAKYMQKQKDTKKGSPFLLMSRRPGIAFDNIKTDMLLTDKIYVNGKYIRLPRYFLKVLESQGCDLTMLKENRLKKGFTIDEILLQEQEVKKRREKIKKIFDLPLDKNFNI